MDRIEKIVKKGTISLSWIENRIHLVFEPDEDTPSRGSNGPPS